MSWRTAAEIVVFMVAAGIVGIIAGFVIGFSTKAAKSWATTTQSLKREHQELAANQQRAFDSKIEEINCLNAELEAARNDASRWHESHMAFLIELKRMSVLTPELLHDEPSVRLQLEEQLEEFSNALAQGGSD